MDITKADWTEQNCSAMAIASFHDTLTFSINSKHILCLIIIGCSIITTGAVLALNY